MKIPKLGTDTKLIIAGVLVLGVGAWYVQRQARAAANGLIEGIGSTFDNIYTSLASGIGGALDSVGSTVRESGDAVAAALGTQGQIDPVTGGYVPFGAVPNPPPGTTYNVPWYLGGGTSDVFNPDGSYSGPGVWGSTSARQAEQADVRRLDNAIANGSYTPPGAWSYLFPNYAK
jgi:hypothetical protein